MIHLLLSYSNGFADLFVWHLIEDSGLYPIFSGLYDLELLIWLALI
jgi:hypothetical protein